MQYKDTLLVHPDNLIKGLQKIDSNDILWDALDYSIIDQTAEDIVMEWSEDWDSDQGFGSSDSTYMLKDYIDTLIELYHYDYPKEKKLKTVFNPYLTIEKQN